MNSGVDALVAEFQINKNRHLFPPEHLKAVYEVVKKSEPANPDEHHSGVYIPDIAEKTGFLIVPEITTILALLCTHRDIYQDACLGYHSHGM